MSQVTNLACAQHSPPVSSSLPQNQLVRSVQACCEPVQAVPGWPKPGFAFSDASLFLLGAPGAKYSQEELGHAFSLLPFSNSFACVLVPSITTLPAAGTGVHSLLTENLPSFQA